MHYFARTTAGLEKIAWLDIQSELGASLVSYGHRRVDFSFTGNCEDVLGLRSVDDVFIHVTKLDMIDHTRPSLKTVRKQIAKTNFENAVDIVSGIRNVETPLPFHITASYLGQRNYSRREIEDAVKAGVLGRNDWEHVQNVEDASLDIRVLVENSSAIVGVRVGTRPLHRRAYKVCNMPGSLKPPVAYCMCLLAMTGPEDVLVDPMCGVGTIAFEASHIANKGLVLGGDISEEATECSQENRAHMQTSSQPQFYRGDANALPMPASSVNTVVSNLPWGRQVLVEGELTDTYAGVMEEIYRVLLPGGHAVLLTDRSDLLMSHAQRYYPDIDLIFAKEISLFGSYPTIHVLKKGLALEDERGPFAENSEFSRGLNRLVDEDGIWQVYR